MGQSILNRKSILRVDLQTSHQKIVYCWVIVLYLCQVLTDLRYIVLYHLDSAVGIRLKWTPLTY